MLYALKLDLIAQQVLEDVAAANEAGGTVFDEDFGGFIPGVEIRGHFKTIGAGVAEDEIISFVDFIDGTVPGKGVGFADIADDGITFGRPVGIADILDTMIGIVEHRPDEVIESAVDADKRGSIRFFYDIHLSDEVTAGADQEFTGFEPDL